MAELVLNLPLAPEPLPHVGVARQLRVQHFQHDRRAKVIARLIHQPHPTFAQLPNDGVAAVCVSRMQHGVNLVQKRRSATEARYRYHRLMSPELCYRHRRRRDLLAHAVQRPIL